MQFVLHLLYTKDNRLSIKKPKKAVTLVRKDLYDMKKLKVAIIGFGGIARSHYAGYLSLAEKDAPVELVAVLDKNPEQLTRQIKINTSNEEIRLPESMHTYTDLEELIATEEFDVADICLPTYLHKEFAVRLLHAGKHVLCEKPMALSSSECAEMLEAERESGKRLMIGQCLRFGPAYQYLKACIEDGRFGKLKNLTMNRLSAAPIWGYENWFMNTERSGGCILDMHIHDVDMARFLLGEPQAVSTVATDGTVRWETQNTRLFYPDLTVVINGSWGETRGTPFVGDFRAVFERATVMRLPTENVIVYYENGTNEIPEMSEEASITREIEFFAWTILEGRENLTNPSSSAATTVRLIEALRESAAQGGAKLTWKA